MRFFIVFAHPEPTQSFNAALLSHGVDGLQSAGHEVAISDLYDMGFNPVASAQDFKARRFEGRLQYDREQKFAAAEDLLADDIKGELDKLFWCDVLVLQFPLCWFSMPAMMKGWIDRIFVNGVVYGSGKRYETGGLGGRRAMIATTTGAYETMFRPNGLLGDLDRALWHIHNGVLHYTGFEVLRPFVGWSPIHNDKAITAGYFDAYRERLLNAAQDMPMRFHPTTDFDAGYQMKPGIRPVSAGHWRP